MSIRLNIGCGQTPTKGWRNYDNSWSIRLARVPILPNVMAKLGFISKPQQEFISLAKNANIEWADVTKHIPENDQSVGVIYSSHMLEHLERGDAISFLKEARRVLKKGGIIRIAVPDIKYLVENYLRDGDADNFIEKTLLTRKKAKTLFEKIRYFVTGDRNHQWMYDGDSLCRLLSTVGFQKPRVVEAGTTIIAESGELDLGERALESVVVETINP
ncbi:MAG: class I SAM-dependent methyltransferase [Nitrososphaera sp.]